MSICSIHIDTSLPIINKEHLELIVGPEIDETKELLDDLVALYIEENAPKIKDLAGAISQNDTEACIRHIHFIAGSSGNMGLSRLCKLCRSLESALRDNSLFPDKEMQTAIKGLHDESVAAYRALV